MDRTPARSKPVTYERAVHLAGVCRKYYGDESAPEVVADGDFFRVHFTKPADVSATPARDAAAGQTWEVRVSGKVTHVLLTRVWRQNPDSWRRRSRLVFSGVNTWTGRAVDGGITRLRRRIS